MYEKFQELLIESKKTPYQVSKDTGVSTSTLSNWKVGNYTPKLDKIKVIADYFGVSIDYFLD
ncbi:helix-turn-helix domain-containing protein [Paenibacillus sp. FSL K6-1230]|uniref:helix-turn-helix domain-containing protein n=1 Tax=Paenibacillus sp. FSL K6-1230 TaxID=2921603 RepID=UPI0030FA50F7